MVSGSRRLAAEAENDVLWPAAVISRCSIDPGDPALPQCY